MAPPCDFVTPPRRTLAQATYVSPLIPLLVGGSVILLTIGGTNVAFGRFWRSDLLDNLRARSIQ